MMKDAEDCEMPYRQVAVHDRVDFGDQRAPGRIQQKAEIATEFGRQQLRQIGSFNWGSHQQKKSVLLSVSVILSILYRYAVSPLSFPARHKRVPCGRYGFRNVRTSRGGRSAGRSDVRPVEIGRASCRERVCQYV